MSAIEIDFTQSVGLQGLLEHVFQDGFEGARTLTLTFKSGDIVRIVVDKLNVAHASLSSAPGEDMFEVLKWTDANVDTLEAASFEPGAEAAHTDNLNQRYAISDVAQLVAQMRNIENATLAAIGILDINPSNVLFKFNHDIENPSPEEFLLINEAKNGENLSGIYKKSVGLNRGAVLEAAYNLATQDVIDITISDEVPPLTLSETVFTKVEIGESITQLVSEVFAKSDWKDSVLMAAEDNELLEERIAAIDNAVEAKLTESNSLSFDSMDEADKMGIRLLLGERESHSAKRLALLKSIDEQILVRDFELEQKLISIIQQKIGGVERSNVMIDLTVSEEAPSDFTETLEAPPEKVGFSALVLPTQSEPEVAVETLVEPVPAIEAVALVDPEPAAVAAPVEPAETFAETLSESLSRIEKASLGVKVIPATGSMIPPIFQEVARAAGLDPYNFALSTHSGLQN